MLTGTAFAQTAAPAAPAPAADAAPVKAKVMKPRKRAVSAVAVTVANMRAVALTELDAAPAGGTAKQIVANLAPGKKAKAKVVFGKSCIFDLHGAYDDGSSTDLTSIDLCKEKNINLVD
jgi:hypothetical protein